MAARQAHDTVTRPEGGTVAIVAPLRQFFAVPLPHFEIARSCRGIHIAKGRQMGFNYLGYIIRGCPMSDPHEPVRDASRIARMLAEQAIRAGEPDHARYFLRVAADADRRADRLEEIARTVLSPGRGPGIWSRNVAARRRP